MPPQIIVLLVQFGLQYGPAAVQGIVKVLNNPSSTVADVEAAFANLKPYSAYNINPPEPNSGDPTPIRVV